MTSESHSISQSVVNAVKAEHSTRLAYEVDDAINKVRERMAGVSQGSETGEAQPLTTREALDRSETGLDTLMAATCQREAAALVALDALIDELTQSGDPDEEVGILKSLRSHLQAAEVQHKKEALGSLERQELANHFKRCLRLQFAQLMRGDNAPSSFDNLERTLRDIEEALVNTWAMEPTQYADVKQAKGSYAYAIARVNIGQNGRTPEVLEVYREVAKEFVVGIFRRWIDGKPTNIERKLNQTSRTDKPKSSEKVTIEPSIATEPKKTLVIAAIAEMVETIVSRMPVTPEAFHNAWRRSETNGDPVAGAVMEAVSGFFFDGFNAGLGDENGSQKVETFARGEEGKSAYYRGAIIRSMIDGAGSTHMYIDATAHLTPTDIAAVAKAAARLMREMPLGSESARDRIAVFILTLPVGAVSTDDREDARLHGESQYRAEMMSTVESVSAQSAQKVGEAIAKAAYLYQTDMKTIAVEMYSGSYEAQRDRAYMNVVRRMALANVAETIVRDSIAGLATLNYSPAEILAASKAVQELKPPFRDRTPAAAPTLADSLSWKLAFATELLDPQTMLMRAPNITSKISERFSGAPKYGVTRAELVMIHNRVAATVAEMNSHLQTRKGNEWTQSNGISFTDVMGVLSSEVTGAYYSARTLVRAPGIKRVVDAQSYGTTEGTVAMYVTDPNSRPSEGYVDSFKPPESLLADADTLDTARAQLQGREEENKFLRLVEERALGQAIKDKAHYQLLRIRSETPAAPGYEALIAEAKQVKMPLARIVGEMPDLPETMNDEEVRELVGYFDTSKFPDSGIGAGMRRSAAKNSAKSFVRNKYGVDIGDFDDKEGYQLDRARHNAQNLINAALAEKKQAAWGAYQNKFEMYRQLLERTLSEIGVTPESFAREAIAKHQILDPKSGKLRSLQFVEQKSGKDERQEVRLGALGERETSDFNTIAKILRESSEAYAAFLSPIIQSFDDALISAQRAGSYQGQRGFKENVLVPAWQKLRPEEYNFTSPPNILDEFVAVLQPILVEQAELIKAGRETSQNPVDNLVQTNSVVTRTVGTMLQ